MYKFGRVNTEGCQEWNSEHTFHYEHAGTSQLATLPQANAETKKERRRKGSCSATVLQVSEATLEVPISVRVTDYQNFHTLAIPHSYVLGVKLSCLCWSHFERQTGLTHL